MTEAGLLRDGSAWQRRPQPWLTRPHASPGPALSGRCVLALRLGKPRCGAVQQSAQGPRGERTPCSAFFSPLSEDSEGFHPRRHFWVVLLADRSMLCPRHWTWAQSNRFSAATLQTQLPANDGRVCGYLVCNLKAMKNDCSGGR